LVRFILGWWNKRAEDLEPNNQEMYCQLSSKFDDNMLRAVGHTRGHTSVSTQSSVNPSQFRSVEGIPLAESRGRARVRLHCPRQTIKLGISTSRSSWGRVLNRRRLILVIHCTVRCLTQERTLSFITSEYNGGWKYWSYLGTPHKRSQVVN